MRNVTAAFMRALAEDKRNYVLRAVITLADNTVLDLGNDSIWEDGLRFEDAVSSDNVFQVGGAIINQATLVLNNIYDDFSEYDFTGAHVVLYVGLDDLDNDTPESVRMCTTTVDEASYNGSIITLKCLDNMAKFDRAYDTNLVYPATLDAIVRDACTRCGVAFATSSLNFPHNDYVVTDKPSEESTTYRQVLSWSAQIAGCFARCNATGELEVKWYDTTALNGFESGLDGGSFDGDATPYSTGDTADGGSFNPWNVGIAYDGGTFSDYPNIDLISSSYQHKLSTDDVIITGVKVIKKVQTETSQDAYVEYNSGTDGYIVVVENNDFIDGTHGQDVATWLGTALIGLRFRQADITHPSDPTIEAGDVAFFWDIKGNRYTIIVSSTTFSCGNSQHTSSSAETPAKNSQQRFTETTRNYVDLRRQQVRDFNSLSQLIEESGGLFETDVQVGSATQKWYHDKPDLEDSEIVMVFTTVGFTLCDDYKTKMDQGLDPTWYGMTVDGQMIASILTATGVNADWINTGAFTVTDANGNITFRADADTGNVIIKAVDVPRQYFGSSAPTASNYPASQWNTDALKAYHEGDLYSDTATKKTYKYTKGIVGSLIKFSSDCATESVAYDWVEIYFTFENQLYKYPKVGGRSTTNTIANKEFFIPATEYKLYWRTDSSGNDYYGWKVGSVTPTVVYELPADAETASSTPSGATDITAQTTTPESEHNPYTNSLKQLWTVQTGNSAGYVYGWQEVVGTDAQEVMDEMTQQEIFDKLTNNGQAQGIYLDNGQLYILFTYAKGGTLTLGGVSNANGILVMKNASDTEIGRWDKDGLSVAQKISLATTGSNSHTYKMVLDEGRQMYYDNNTLVASMYTVLGPSTYPFYISYKDSFNVQGFTSGYSSLSIGNSVGVTGNFSATGTKSRLVEDTRYGDRLLYAYETPTPYFGDIGTGKTDGTGEAVINIDDIFDATVNVGIEYCVFLQKEGPGDLWVDEKESTYFVVKGEPDTKFSWEIKAVQKGYENLRLDDNALVKSAYVNDDDIGLSMDADLALLDSEDLFSQEDYL